MLNFLSRNSHTRLDDSVTETSSVADDSEFAHHAVDTSTVFFGEDLKSNVDMSQGVSSRIPSWLKNTTKSLERFLFPHYPKYYSFQKKLRLATKSTKAGGYWTILQVLMSVTVVILYIAESVKRVAHLSTFTDVLEATCMAFFALDFILSMMVAEGFMPWILDFNTWVDVATLVPWIVDISSSYNPNLNFLRVARVSRLFHVHKSVNFVPRMERVTSQLTHLVIDLVVLMIFAACVVQLVEDRAARSVIDCQFINNATNWEPSCYEDAPTDGWCDCSTYNCEAVYSYADDPYPSGFSCMVLDFFDSIWFMIVTASTVGYGDISPLTNYGRLIVIIFIFTFLYFLPARLQDISDLLSSEQRYIRIFNKPREGKYLLLVGHLDDPNSVLRVLSEIFSSGRTNKLSGMEVVVLSPKQLSKEVLDIIESPAFGKNVRFIMGSVLSSDDLQRIDARKADSVFIMCDKNSRNPEKEDTFSIVTTLSMENCNSEIQTYAQVIRPKNKGILKKDADFVLCLDEMRAALLAKNLLSPGSATLISNLFTSFAVPRGKNRKEWQQEYIRGMDIEIYPIKIPKQVWEKFNYDYYHLTTSIYLATSHLIIGLCSGVESFEDYKEIQLAPPNEKVNIRLTKKYPFALLLCQEQDQAVRLQELFCMPIFLENLLNMPKPRPGDGAPSEESLERKSTIPKRADLHSLTQLSSKENLVTTLQEKLHIPLPTSGPEEGVLHTIPKLEDSEFSERVVDTVIYGDFKMEKHLLLYGDLQVAKTVLKFLREEDFSSTVMWRPILILTSQTINQEDYDFISKENDKYKHIYLKQASGNESDDLTAAGINEACACLVLKSSQMHEEYDDFELGQDGVNIMRFLRLADCVDENLDFYCVELLNENSVAILNATTQRRENDLRVKKKEAEKQAEQAMGVLEGVDPDSNISPRVESGARERAISKSMMEIYRLEESEFNLKTEEDDETLYGPNQDVFFLKEFYASGKCFVPNILDVLMVQAYYSFNSAIVCDRLLRGSEHCHLFLCSIPADYFNEGEETTFFDVLYKFLHHRESLAIALYRAPTDENGACFQYVYTCPEPTRTLVNREDQVYLLGPSKCMRDIEVSPLHQL